VLITHFCVICPTFDEVIVELAWYLESWSLRVNDGQSLLDGVDVIVSNEVPPLDAWIESPEYPAEIVMRPGLNGAVYTTMHEAEDGPAEDRVHEEPPKVPPEPPSFQLTVPVGVLGELLVSMMVPVKVIMLPATTDAGFGVTLVEVVCRDEVDPPLIASVITPKSQPCEVPNESVAEESGLEVISYCA
jgi:hypothetical protein